MKLIGSKEALNLYCDKLRDDELLSIYKEHNLKEYPEEIFKICEEIFKKRGIVPLSMENNQNTQSGLVDNILKESEKKVNSDYDISGENRPKEKIEINMDITIKSIWEDFLTEIFEDNTEIFADKVIPIFKNKIVEGEEELFSKLISFLGYIEKNPESFMEFIKQCNQLRLEFGWNWSSLPKYYETRNKTFKKIFLDAFTTETFVISGFYGILINEQKEMERQVEEKNRLFCKLLIFEDIYKKNIKEVISQRYHDIKHSVDDILEGMQNNIKLMKKKYDDTETEIATKSHSMSTGGCFGIILTIIAGIFICAAVGNSVGGGGVLAVIFLIFVVCYIIGYLSKDNQKSVERVEKLSPMEIAIQEMQVKYTTTFRSIKENKIYEQINNNERMISSANDKETILKLVSERSLLLKKISEIFRRSV